MMDRVMHNVLIKDPFIKEDHRAKKPLYAALVPDEIFKGSHFERRFVTPFGSAWETLAVVAANEGLGYGVTGHSISGTVKDERLRRIAQVLNKLEHPEQGKKRIKPDWNTRTLAEIFCSKIWGCNKPRSVDAVRTSPRPATSRIQTPLRSSTSDFQANG